MILQTQQTRQTRTDASDEFKLRLQISKPSELSELSVPDWFSLIRPFVTFLMCDVWINKPSLNAFVEVADLLAFQVFSIMTETNSRR